MIIGYKCFKEGLINHYNMQFEVGKSYSITGPVEFGTKGNGFHICTNLEDTFRYYMDEEKIELCLVVGDGENIKYDDEYYGYYDMYAVESITIIRKLSREEIIDYGLNLLSFKLIRFIQTCKLSQSEIEIFKKHFCGRKDVLDAIAYYQEHDMEVYSRKLVDKQQKTSL